MNHHTFISALESLSGLEDSMVIELIALSPSLTPEQRAKAIRGLTLLSEKFLQLQQTFKEIAEEASAILSSLRHTLVPRMRHVEETIDHESEIQKTESLLSS